MSASVELQTLIYDTLLADTQVAALVGDRVYDGPPASRTYPCITFGPMDYVPEDMTCILGRLEAIQIDVWSRENGRLWPCKQICDAVKNALHEADLSLAVNALVRIEVTGVLVFADADGVTAHGVVSIEADLEEQVA